MILLRKTTNQKEGKMRKVLTIFFVLVIVMFLVGITSHYAVGQGKGKAKGKNKDLWCTKIQDGILLTSDGRVIQLGFDEWGYNYQGHIFVGGYCDAYRDADWCQPYEDVRLMMKWNDAWLSNNDCDGDGLLDRHYGFDSYIGSGAWLTNHQYGSYINEYGELCHWNYFVKIVAAPADAVKVDGIWYTSEGEEIGPVIWGAFAIIQKVYNDPFAGDHGIEYKTPVGPGFGKFKK